MSGHNSDSSVQLKCACLSQKGFDIRVRFKLDAIQMRCRSRENQDELRSASKKRERKRERDTSFIRSTSDDRERGGGRNHVRSQRLLRNNHMQNSYAHT